MSAMPASDAAIVFWINNKERNIRGIQRIQVREVAGVFRYPQESGQASKYGSNGEANALI
jgi:hypothetical protein